MLYRVNLANKPFQNRSLFWLSLTLGLVIVLFLGVWVTQSSAAAAVEARALDERLATQEREKAVLLQNQPKPPEPVNLTQQDYEALRAAQELIGRRAMSWTSLLSHLERITPRDVRVVSISVARGEPGSGERRGLNVGPVNWLTSKVPLTLEVATKDDRKITGELLPAFTQQSATFSAFVVEQQPQPETGETIFKIAVDYTPPGAALQGGSR